MHRTQTRVYGLENGRVTRVLGTRVAGLHSLIASVLPPAVTSNARGEDNEVRSVMI